MKATQMPRRTKYLFYRLLPRAFILVGAGLSLFLAVLQPLVLADKAETENVELKEEQAKIKPKYHRVDKVKFYDDVTKKNYSYAIRLPSYYDENKKYPVIFIFDPMGNGQWINDRMCHAADKLSWIEVGSFDVKNDILGKTVNEIQDALMRDVMKRFKVDEKHFYAAGHSGGARAAIHFAYRYPENFRGVFASCAGLAAEEGVKQKTIAIYFFTGKKDFNYGEVKWSQAFLDRIDCKNEMFVSEKGHEWPSFSEAAKGLDWLAELDKEAPKSKEPNSKYKRPDFLIK